MSGQTPRRGNVDGRQVALATVLLVAGTAFLTLPRVAAAPAGPAAWLGVILGSLLALPAGWLLLLLYQRHPERSLVATANQLLGPFLGGLLGLGLVAWSHYYLAVLVREFAGVFVVAFMPETPVSPFLAVIVVILIYGAYQGIEAIVRTAQVFLPFILASLVLILAGVFPRFNPGHLLPLSAGGRVGTALATLYTFSVFGQSIAVTALFPRLRQPRETRPALVWGYALAAFALATLTAVELGAFSAPVLKALAFPTLSAARLIRVGLFFERFEAGFMVVWFVLSVLKLCLFFFFATATLAEVLGLPDQKVLCLPGGVIVAFTALFPDDFADLERLVLSLYQYGALAFLVPAALLGASWLFRRGKSGVLLVLIACLSVAALTASGCWSRRELEDTAFVLTFGVDSVTPGKTKLALQAIIPAMLSSGGKGEGGGKGGSGSGDTGPMWVATAEGPTVFAALRDLEKRASDRLFLAHARAVIFSEQAARAGIDPVLDFAYRERQIRETADLLVTPDPLDEVFKTIPTQEKIPALYLNNLLEHSQLHGTSARLDLLSYRVYTSHPGTAVAVPRLRIYRPPGAKPDEKPSEFVLEGAAILKDGRLVGQLSPKAVPGLLWLTNRAQQVPVTFSDPRRPKTRVAAEIISSDAVRRVVVDATDPARTIIRVDVKGEGNLREVAAYESQGKSDLRALNRALSREVAHQIWRAVSQSRRARADVFGFAEQAREGLPPREWPAVAKRWPEIFAAAQVDVRVDLRLRRQGMTF
ncbi:MAG: Ger(x)C family spore germination protein [Methanocella sp.]